MAKIIKCPKCGENVEIPPNAAGTVVKCANCGTGLRVKAKAQPAGGGEADRSQGSMGGSMSGSVSGSLAGTVIGQTAYGQQEPDPDGPPNLGSDCAVCGRSVDPNDLIEDRGQLVCSKCAKRPARSAGGAGAAAAPALMPEPDFDPALRHGPMVNVNGAFIGGCAALAIVGACQAFLYFYPKPIGAGRAVVSTTNVAATKPSIPTVVSWEDQNRDAIRQTIEDARKLVGTDAKGAVAKYDEAFLLIGDRNIVSEPLKGMVETARADRTKLATEIARAPVAPPPDAPPAPVPATQEAVATNTEAPGPGAPAPDQAESMPEATKPGNIFELPPDTPELLSPALIALSEKKYPEAVEALRNVRPPSTPSRDQRLTLETLAAANLGVGKYEYAEGLLKRASDSYSSSGAPVTRSLVLNRASAQLAARKPAYGIAKELTAYLTQKGGPSDEMTQAILGTAISRVEQTPKIKAEYDQFVGFLNTYTAQLDATRQAEGKRRWGAAWYDATLVTQWETHIQGENEKIKALEPELDRYLTQRQGAALGTKENVAAAEANYKRVSGEIYAIRQGMKKYEKKWLDKFEPVMPEPEESALPPPPTPDAADAPAPAPPPPPPPPPQ